MLPNSPIYDLADNHDPAGSCLSGVSRRGLRVFTPSRQVRADRGGDFGRLAFRVWVAGPMFEAVSGAARDDVPMSMVNHLSRGVAVVHFQVPTGAGCDGADGGRELFYGKR